ncbi:class I SAM-dependent methyltransferase [Streptomyces sp. NPDC003703]|uniref:class I SAM-dependent methyltransferase n=1 Tax=Streptomyces sp. NPDC003283 TaxID=3364681 RepID=UPI0036AA7184
MTPTLVRRHPSLTGPAPRVDQCARARDWSEIQERMLVPLYEAVHERLGVGPGTRLLALGCGTGLALLLAAARGAEVTGTDTRSAHLALARERLLPAAPGAPGTAGTRACADAASPARTTARLTEGPPAARGHRAPYTLVTAFEPLGCPAGDPPEPAAPLAAAVPLAGRGAPVVLAGWGPPERCAAADVLRVATRPADPLPVVRDRLEDVARDAGLRPDGSGRVACPFGYADLDSAVRGMLSTGWFDPAIATAGHDQVVKELAEALHAHRRRDGTVWMPNVFRYLIARTP